jgi:hypothetical protein
MRPSCGTHAVADPDVVLEALEMDVRRTLLHRVGEDGVEQLDDRRVLHLRRELRGRLVLFLLLEDLHVVADVVDDRHEVGDLRIDRTLVQLLDDALEREFSPDDGEDVVARDELEVVQDAEVGRIGHGHGEGATVALEREDEILDRDVGRDQLRDAGVDLELGEVHRRHLVLPGEHLRELGFLDETELDEVIADPGSALPLLLKGLFQLLTRNEPLANEEVTETFAGSGRSCH